MTLGINFRPYAQKKINQHLCLNGTLIQRPQNNCLYHLKYPGGEIRVRFLGKVELLSYFDASIGIFGRNAVYDFVGCLRSDKYCFVSSESLPASMRFNDFPPVLLHYYQAPDLLHSVSDITVDLDSGFDCLSMPVAKIKTSDSLMLAQYQQLANNIPVIGGAHPLFFDSKKPSLAAFSPIIQEFLNFNTIDKLRRQQKQTEYFCHVRAYFISQLLRRRYGITAQLACKYWDEEQWDASVANKWIFHTVALIGEWIFDPWDEPGHNGFISFKQWMQRSDQPRPYKVMINNQTVFSDIADGLKEDGPILMSSGHNVCPEYVSTFQFLCSEALFEPVEKPLVSAASELKQIIEHYSFFRPNAALNEQSVNNVPVLPVAPL